MQEKDYKSLLGKVWKLREQTAADSEQFDLISQILSSRGIIGDDAIQKFLNPSIKEYMPDPSVMADMDAAAGKISDAVLNGKKIAVFGDYDVDGITATAVMVKFLRSVGADVIWHLPMREGEGYGLNIGAIDELHAAGAELIITVDCGISAVKEVAYAKSLGTDIVITDHHSPDLKIPDADAVVDPKRVDDTSGLSYLAGVGVAFMTVVAVNRELKKSLDFRVKSLDSSKPEQNSVILNNNQGLKHLNSQLSTLNSINLLDLLDLVALGTICDTVPLVGLNRALVSTGIKVMAVGKNIGLRALMNAAGIKSPTTYGVMFGIGPRLNAAGRLDSAAPALELLLTDNILIANDLAAKLNAMNQERMDIQNAIMCDAADMAQKCCDSGKCSVFVCGDNWRTGVIGIIAGRLKDQFARPTCVATKSDGIIDGSGRSIPGVDLGKIIHAAVATGIITAGGGHAAAAGFSLAAENQDAFCEFLEKSVLEQLNGQMPEAVANADAELDVAAADMNLVKKLSALEPFGQDNPEPVLILRGGTLVGGAAMGRGNVHIRGTVAAGNGARLNFVGFNMTDGAIGNFLLDDENINSKITLIGKLKENEYNGRVSAQFVLEDIVI